MHAFRAVSSSVRMWTPLLLALSMSAVLSPMLAADASKPSLDQFMLKRGYRAVPLETDEYNHLIVRGKLNGKRILCLLDTGSSGNVLDKTRAGSLERLGKDSRPRNATLGKLTSVVKVVRMDQITLASVEITNQIASVYDLHQDLHVHTGSHIPTSDRPDAPDLILGIRFLRSTHAFIYYPGQVLYLRLEAPSAELASVIEKSLLASGLVSVPLSGPDVLFAPIQVNGREARLLLDTGAIYTMLDSSQRADFQLGRAQPTGIGIIDAGANRGEIYSTLNSFRVGTFEITNLPVATRALPLLRESDPVSGKESAPPLLGILGPELLARGGALIDCAGTKLYLQPLQPKPSRN